LSPITVHPDTTIGLPDAEFAAGVSACAQRVVLARRARMTFEVGVFIVLLLPLKNDSRKYKNNNLQIIFSVVHFLVFIQSILRDISQRTLSIRQVIS
jgi:hypothetical protein